ncbi:hypothetical protein B0H14DRAFT_2338433 [Mycena olivaceomarginata]|nr:hypothetical protein B0H14DRAFT_2416241 [Mycena olivaceomarginata]KAJ7708499.1 hypothetical protein B0H14DRAFT_2415347 [Mycena olivaceomarginata]KAJ7886263.1 hypothetical protein B0H14DRAFT_2338433 [Mycena olivaceomarginata]
MHNSDSPSLIDLLQRIAPRRYAQQLVRIQQLHDNNFVSPAFQGSAFTTAQFNFGNGMSIIGRDTYDEFGSLRALTVLGDYDPVEGSWFLYWPGEEDDRFALYCPPGTTLLIPGSVVRYAFSAIQKGETRYIFQQYFSAALGRWVEHGLKSDAAHDEALQSSDEERAADHEICKERVEHQVALMSHVDELFL